eukprot:6128009-Amphidinium_carterae.1
MKGEKHGNKRNARSFLFGCCRGPVGGAWRGFSSSYTKAYNRTTWLGFIVLYNLCCLVELSFLGWRDMSSLLQAACQACGLPADGDSLALAKRLMSGVADSDAWSEEQGVDDDASQHAPSMQSPAAEEGLALPAGPHASPKTMLQTEVELPSKRRRTALLPQLSGSQASFPAAQPDPSPELHDKRRSESAAAPHPKMGRDRPAEKEGDLLAHQKSGRDKSREEAGGLAILSTRELRLACKARSLDMSGEKEELIQRLVHASRLESATRRTVEDTQALDLLVTEEASPQPKPQGRDEWQVPMAAQPVPPELPLPKTGELSAGAKRSSAEVTSWLCGTHDTFTEQRPQPAHGPLQHPASVAKPFAPPVLLETSVPAPQHSKVDARVPDLRPGSVEVPAPLRSYNTVVRDGDSSLLLRVKPNTVGAQPLVSNVLRQMCTTPAVSGGREAALPQRDVEDMAGLATTAPAAASE